jgi:hypothetical protein
MVYLIIERNRTNPNKERKMKTFKEIFGTQTKGMYEVSLSDRSEASRFLTDKKTPFIRYYSPDFYLVDASRVSVISVRRNPLKKTFIL